MTYDPRSLHEPVRVYADGTIVYGIDVPHEGANLRGDARLLAAPPRSGRSRRFAPNRLPAGVDQHLPCTARNCEACLYIDMRVRGES